MAVSVLAAAMVAAVAAAGEPIPLDDFVKYPRFLDVEISPTGEYLAASVLATEDTGALVVMRRADLSVTGTMKLAGRSFVNDFAWVSDERIVLSVAERLGALTAPVPTGELFATNRDGKDQQVLIGLRRDGGLEAQRGKGRFAYATLIDPLRDDDRHVLVQVYGIEAADNDTIFASIERLDVGTGKRKVVARAPVRNAIYRTDAAGAVRTAHGLASDASWKLHVRDGTQWQLVNNEASSGQKMEAVGIHRDGKRVIVRSSEDEGPDGLYAWNPASNAFDPIYRHRVVDPHSFVYDSTGTVPIGAYYMDGRPTLEVLDREAPEIKVVRTLAASFPEEWVVPRSWSRDGRLLVFSVESDRNPGTFYLFDRDTRQATFLLAVRPWIEPERMAEMEPFEFVARDGVTVHGFITLPPGSDGSALPMVVIPHGEAFAGFTRWGFNAEAQLLASRGYAVMHVNYRGSENYGESFMKRGYRQWGAAMQDDVTDATRWAIAQGIAAKDRVCLYGVDYGAYAAAMGLAKEPELYRCAIGGFGFYDLGLLYTRGTIAESDTGKNYLAKALGTGRENLKQRSPVALADRIEAPMLLVVGARDTVAPPAHARALRAALTKAGNPPEWLENREEGHGFFKEASNRELYTRLLAFLDKHIGNGGAGAVAAGE